MKKFVFLICTLLIGCGGITDKGIKEAYKICEKNGGVESITPLYITTSDAGKVYCKNGNIIVYIMY